MGGTGSVTVDGAAVYAHFTTEAGRVRLRVSADERDRLGLDPGRPVALGLLGRPAVRALVTGVRADPPFAWVEFETAGAGTARAA